MSRYIKKKFVKFERTQSNVQIDCYHNCPPGQEFYVEEIVRGVCESVGCSSVLAMVSRFTADLNCEMNDKNIEAISEYREVLQGNFKLNGNLEKPYLLIILHGMKNREGKDIEIGTRSGKLASVEITKWFVGRMRDKFSNMKVVDDEEFGGPDVLENHRKLFGKNLNIFQIELSLNIREKFRRDVVSGISEILEDFKEEII